MNERKENRSVNAVVILTSFSLMQWHSIEFWLSVAGYSGPAWSVGLEIAMLWLWYDRKHRIVKFIAALILIAGPWYQITSPAIENIQITNRITSGIEIQEKRFDQLSKSIERYEDNSNVKTGRAGWAGRIDRTQRALDDSADQINVLRSDLSGRNIPWRSYMVTLIQSAALLIILTAQLSAVSSLGTEQKMNTKETHPEKIHARPKPSRDVGIKPKQKTKDFDGISMLNLDDFDKAVEIVAAEIKTELPNYKSQKALAECLGIKEKPLSLILNHKKRKSTGGELVSSNALTAISKALEIHR